MLCYYKRKVNFMYADLQPIQIFVSLARCVRVVVRQSKNTIKSNYTYNSWRRIFQGSDLQNNETKNMTNGKAKSFCK